MVRGKKEEISNASQPSKGDNKRNVKIHREYWREKESDAEEKI